MRSSAFQEHKEAEDFIIEEIEFQDETIEVIIPDLSSLSTQNEENLMAHERKSLPSEIIQAAKPKRISITGVIEQLKWFADDKTTYEIANEVIEKLTQFKFLALLLPLLDQLGEEEIKDLNKEAVKHIEPLRKDIQQYINNQKLSSTKKGDKLFGDVLYDVLIAITAVHPINKDDPFTYFPPDENDVLFTSDGFQYDFKSLKRWIEVEKKINNPFNGKPFLPRDIKEFKRVGISIQEQKFGPQAPTQLDWDAIGNAQGDAIADTQELPPFFGLTAVGLFSSEADSLSWLQRELFSELKEEGLTVEHIRNWQRPLPEFDERFMEAHYNTVIYLVREQHLAPQLAMQQINKLDEEQVALLRALYSHGLRGDHIRSWQPPTIGEPMSWYFWETHKTVVIYLMCEKNLTPEQSIEQINKLTSAQVALLKELYNDGLRGEHLRNWQPSAESGGELNPFTFTVKHMKAVLHLVQNQHLSPEQAMQQINGITAEQAEQLVPTYIIQVSRSM